jgi:hypothetical protein
MFVTFLQVAPGARGEKGRFWRPTTEILHSPQRHFGFATKDTETLMFTIRTLVADTNNSNHAEPCESAIYI